ncbi:MAG: hypothetical protein Q7R96_02495 [Nanoarchaeota archaeon]|nr:hypothetical protein [Nanoarchaeota archaeon]
MGAMKKGVIMTLALMFFCLVIFLFSFLTFKNGLLVKSSLAETSEIEIVKQRFNAVQYAFVDMFSRDLNVNISKNQSGVHIQHLFLPLLAALDTHVSDYITNTEDNFPIVISKRFDASNLSMMYARQDNPFAFYHYRWLVGSPRQVIIDSDPLVNKYELVVFSPDANGTPSFSATSGGSVNLSIVVKGRSKYRATASALIDPTSGTNSVVSISGLSGVVNITVGSSRITINDFLGASSNLSLMTSMNITQVPLWYLPSQVYVAEDTVWKNATPRVY